MQDPHELFERLRGKDHDDASAAADKAGVRKGHEQKFYRVNQPFKGFDKNRGFHSSDAAKAAAESRSEEMKEHEQSHWGEKKD